MNRNPTQPKVPRQGMRRLLVLAALADLACLLVAGPALAGTVTDRPLLFSFDGSDTTAGAFSSVGRLAIDQSSGTVYVIDQGGKNVLDKFNAAGQAQSFSATGGSSLAPGFTFPFKSVVAVDNSAVNPGRIHLLKGGDNGGVKAFNPAGEALWEAFGGVVYAAGSAVDAEGHPWVGDNIELQAREFDNAGSPPAQIGSCPLPYQVGALDLDASGNLYVYGLQGTGGIDKYTGCVKVATIDSGVIGDVTVDQSSASGHLFTLHGENFNEYDSAGSPLGSFAYDVFRSGEGIAYHKALDRVYVSDAATKTVKVFGPAITGTVPDLTIEPTTAIGVHAATANATINPQGVPNSYHFEWKQGTGGSWSGAQSSPPESIAPTDSVDHQVSFAITGLRSNTTYQVRLVATNTDNNLNAYSAPDTFTTPKPPPPTVTDLSISQVTADSAHLAATIDPQEDTTTWRVQSSTDPSCAGGFADVRTATIFNPGPGTVAVTWDLTGLLPAQTYCVRIVATNGGGTTTSAPPVPFTTLAIPPDQVQTAFAAPRTDTGARINARVNPEGSATTYHFEWSADGTNWTALPDQQTAAEIRTQIVVSDELGGLDPETTYHFRFFASNAAGPATPQGEAGTFTTRTSAEATLPERGIELVNSPDKGNQNVDTIATPQNVPKITPDGDRALWSVLSGAPGAPNASYNTFLAARSAAGWSSRALVPPATEQVGSGNLTYQILLAVPDLSRFVFGVGGNNVVRLDDGQNQDLLATNIQLSRAADLTDDGAHVVIVDDATRQLKEVGSGTPEVVSLMPDGSESGCGLVEGRFAGPAASSMWRPGYRWIAATDASRVYFQAPPNGACGAPLGLYVRNRDTQQTTLIAAGSPGGDLETRNVRFIRATPDGRSAYFLTLSALDPADSNGHRDVYRWDEGAGASICLTCVVADADPRGTVLVSDDFSHVYFESTRQLVPGQGAAGDVNLYLLSGGEIRFVADPNNNDGTLSQGNPELSADGNVFLFAATASPRLTTDPASQCPTSGGQAGPCQKLYRYDDRDRSLECLDCRRGQPSTRHISGSRLSADGSTVAFTTAEALLPLDVNRDTDVYEWRNGSRRLLTDGLTDFAGAGGGAPLVWDLDASGANILFSVAAPGLTGFEADGLANLYDARIGGGFPPPSPPVHCSEDSCQGPLQPPPTDASGGSSTFFGPGNPPAIFPRSCSRARRRVRVTKRRLRRATSPSAKRAARKRLRLAKRRLRRCRAGRR